MGAPLGVSAEGCAQDGRDVDPTRYPSAEELLEEYWGPLWASVRSEALEAGLELETYPIADVPDWSATRADLMSRLQEERAEGRAKFLAGQLTWGRPLDLGAPEIADLTDWDSVPEQDLVGVEAAIEPYNRMIASVAENYQSALDLEVLSSLDDPGTCVVHPIIFPRKTLATPPLDADELLYLNCIAIDGWTLQITIDRRERPEFDSWIQDIERAIAARKLVVMDYLRAAGHL